MAAGDQRNCRCEGGGPGQPPETTCNTRRGRPEGGSGGGSHEHLQADVAGEDFKASTKARPLNYNDLKGSDCLVQSCSL